LASKNAQTVKIDYSNTTGILSFEVKIKNPAKYALNFSSNNSIILQNDTTEEVLLQMVIEP
jgi:hypothetical protein